jgi:ATP-dependent RNA helicase RhlE
MTFEQFGLAEPILRAVVAEGYTTPTPVQIKAIPHVLKGRDVLGCAQTGTGKTAAFALPILHRLGQPQARDRRRVRAIRVLVLTPTRELAAQIGLSFGTYGRHTALRQAVIFGGVNQNPQVHALRSGVDILVATPGRLLDLMQQGLVDLRHLEVLVLDEADRMLDMGFIADIRRIIAKVPRRRQTLLFSATMPPDIRELADTILSGPVYVRVAAVSMAADTVGQSVYLVEKRDKPAMLEHFLTNNQVGRALVFTRTKHGADRVARSLSRAGIVAEALHGNKSQNARTRAMSRFKSSTPPVLVATDIAARGLDIDEISHVINYDMPNIPETYVHRIGRTGRAGASGLAVSLCDSQELPYLKDIERLILKPIPVHPDCSRLPAPEPRPPERKPRSQQSALSRDHRRRNRTGIRQDSTNDAPSAASGIHALRSSAADGQAKAKPPGMGYRSRGRRRLRRGAFQRSR